MVSWKTRIKSKIPISGIDESLYLSAYTQAVGWKMVTHNGHITEYGYKMYLTLLGIVGKKSLHNAPPRHTYIWFEKIDTLKEFGLVIYNEVKYEYTLTSKGNQLSKVLANSLTNNGTPTI
tara:strand:- start:1786 stop:2145 length:360 start_codon:yes stop_codon:yes gene_type:complete